MLSSEKHQAISVIVTPCGERFHLLAHLMQANARRFEKQEPLYLEKLRKI